VKSANTLTRVLDEAVLLDGKLITKIRFDLEHINRGWDKELNDYNKTKRSHYTSDDIVDFFEQLRLYAIKWDSQNKLIKEIKGQCYYRYLAYVWDLKKKKRKKIVIDVSEDFKGSGIIVTVY
jgi:hypothetical protein